MTCALCKEGPALRGRKCAFDAQGRFVRDNWMCLTLGRLRSEALWSHRDDMHNESISIFAMPESQDDWRGYLVLTYYKNRGSVGRVVLMVDDVLLPLTLPIAEAAVRGLT